ncbi:hypothetical protein K469DRAFT_567710 [Zopfia rhizophila CBS 207.26]|uniref:Rhodopsin domain-containing protein n=1 Tax=Zopfia rhizophila CBS 207.26 TaxID=1314779 RepID=A0A6A6EBV4_9PEZI|nr:hypothetical protein K469DRAFT_567710 [Zopfia rhizophila CBS 207.26]
MQLLPEGITVLLERPAMLPPKGVKSDVTNRSNTQTSIVIYSAVCLGIASIFMLVRLYTKIRIVRKVDITDSQTLHQSTLCIRLPSLLLLKANSQWLNIEQILFACTIVLVKIAILLQYLVIFAPNKTVNPFMYIGARILIVAIVTCYATITIVNNVSCSPRERIWNPLIRTGHCMPNARKLGSYFLQGLNIVSDLMILLLPATSIWRLRIPLKKKIGITFQLAVGTL